MHIPLSNSDLRAVIDEEDFGLVGGFRWRLEESRGYLSVRAYPGEYTILMSRLVARCLDRPEKDVHHRDGDTLNNRKSNLVIVRHGLHTVVSKLQAPPIRGRRFKGVHCRPSGSAMKPWRAMIRLDGKLVHLGSFATEEDAARAYDRAVERVYGNIPGLKPYKNFPERRE